MVQPYFSEMDEFCVAVERLLRRILTDDDWDDPDIVRIARWFALWFNSLGMTLSYIQEECEDVYNKDDKQIGTRIRWRISLYHYQLRDRSYFYVNKGNDSAEAFVDRLEDTLKSIANKAEIRGSSSDWDVRSITTSIHCFLNEHPDAENTFELFAEKFTTG